MKGLGACSGCSVCVVVRGGGGVEEGEGEGWGRMWRGGGLRGGKWQMANGKSASYLGGITEALKNFGDPLESNHSRLTLRISLQGAARSQSML